MPTDYDPFRAHDAGDEDNAPEEVEEPREEETPEEPQEEPVKSGTTREVLEWVGDDKDKARRALDAEKADSSPRKGLVRELEELLEEDK